ncbi:hypothetical protein FRC0477_00706 [Corynebacterium diphtheriae]|nr:hypothetical protein FRC0477_00706 [Corynebacterium diphtheriae]
MKHTEWLHMIAGDSAVNAIANRSGIVPRTFARQVKDESISAENVIAIALSYDAHPVRALVDTGYLDEQYATEVDPATALKEVSEQDLANEVLKRMIKGLKTEALTVPIEKVYNLNEHRRSTPVSPPSVRAVSDDDSEGSDDMQYAASRRKRQPSEGDDDYGPGA